MHSPFEPEPTLVEPPNDAQTEQLLLGALLSNPGKFDLCIDLCSPEDFYQPLNGRLYKAIGDAQERRMPAVETVRALARQDPDLVHLNGDQYVADLVASVISVLEAPNYARRIRDLAVRRKLLEIGQDLIADAHAEDINRPAIARLESAEERLYELAERREDQGPQPVADAMQAAFDRIEEAQTRDGIAGVTTGLQLLDSRFQGLKPGLLYVIAGRPQMGKSVLAQTIAVNAARAGTPVLFFTLEMPIGELAQRMLASMTGISVQQQTTPGSIDSARGRDLMKARTELTRLPLHMDETPAIKLAQLRSRARRHKRRHGLGLILIDYLQLMGHHDPKQIKVYQIQDLTTGIKSLAKELQVPIVLLSQLNRDVEKRDDKRPMLSDLRDSGSIEQDSDVVMFVYREVEYLRKNQPRDDRDMGKTADWSADMVRLEHVMEVITDKHRQGAKGSDIVRFDGVRQVVEDVRI